MAGSSSANGIAEYTCVNSGIPSISLSQVSLYPNPAKDRINISCENIPLNSTIEFFDVQGRSIDKLSISSGKTELELPGIVAGVYFYHLSAKTGEILFNGKLIIE